jgi:hypothetical protein
MTVGVIVTVSRVQPEEAVGEEVKVYHGSEMASIGNLEEGEALGRLGVASDTTLHGPVFEGRLVEGRLAGPGQVACPHVTADVVANEVFASNKHHDKQPHTNT